MKCSALLLFVLVPNAVWAFDDHQQIIELKAEVEALKQSQTEVRQTLQLTKDIKDILMGKTPALEDTFIKIAGSPVMGDSAAEVTIVEFSDFQCPYCGAYAKQTFPRLVNEYVKTGKVRYVVRNFPLHDIHPLAEKAAEAAQCTGAQGDYWQVRDQFFKNQQALRSQDFLDYAAAHGLDPATLQNCIDTGKFAAVVKKDLADGEELGIRGTPTFFVGFSDPSDPTRMQAVTSLAGNVPYHDFEKAIAKVTNRAAGRTK